MVKCEVCGAEVKARGLSAHVRNKHAAPAAEGPKAEPLADVAVRFLIEERARLRIEPGSYSVPKTRLLGGDLYGVRTEGKEIVVFVDRGFTGRIAMRGEQRDLGSEMARAIWGKKSLDDVEGHELTPEWQQDVATIERCEKRLAEIIAALAAPERQEWRFSADQLDKLSVSG
jgi:hypothetical protein